MPIVQHIWELILLLIFLGGPIPLGLLLVLSHRDAQRSQAGVAHYGLIFLTSWCVVQTGLGLVLGMVQRFNGGAVAAAELLLLIAGSVLLQWRYRNSVRTRLQAVLTLERPFDRNEVLILGAIAFAGFVLLERLMTQPIINFDSLAYHLPAMARWIQTGTFSVLEQFQADVGWYPYGWEVLCTLLMLPFQEDFLVALPNLFAWSILGLSVYRLARTAGALRIYSMAAACLVLTMPLLMQHINTIHVDVPFAAFFMSGLYFLVSFHQRRTVVDFVLFLTSVGVLLGIKTSAIVYTALLFAILILLEVQAWLRHGSGRKEQSRFPFFVDRWATALSVAGVLCFLLIGTFWYVRNWIAMGNPLGFVEIRIGNQVIFPGYLTSAEVNRNSLAKIFNPLLIEHWVILLGRTVFWLQLPFVLMVIQVFRLPWVMRKPQGKILPISLISVLALSLLTGWLYWNTPYSAASSGVESEIVTWRSSLFELQLSSFFGKALRFAFPFLAMLGVLAATSATLVGVNSRVVAFGVLLSTIVCTVETTIIEAFFANSFRTGGGTVRAIVEATQVSLLQGMGAAIALLAAHSNLVFNILCLILVLGLGWQVLKGAEPMPAIGDFFAQAYSRLAGRMGQPMRTLLVVACVGLLVTGSLAARERRDANRQEVYGGIYEWLAAQVNPDAVIGYTDSYRSYLFYGKNYRRHVVFVPAEQAGTLSNWLETLEQRQVDLVAIGPVPSAEEWQEFPQASWFEGADSPLMPVYGEKPWVDSKLYRLEKQS
jgi:hypothetical protein